MSGRILLLITVHIVTRVTVCGFHIYKNVWEPTIARVNFILQLLVTDHFTCFSITAGIRRQWYNNGITNDQGGWGNSLSSGGLFLSKIG